MLATMKRNAVAEQLAEIADREGLLPKHVVRLPKLVEEIGVEIGVEDVEMAGRLQRDLIDKTLRKATRHETSIGPREQVETKKRRTKKEQTEETKTRVKVLGYSATAVIRWMGKNKWSFEDAALALVTLECYLSDATIRIQLKAGEKGERGAPAPITKAQARVLKEATK